MNRQFLTGFDDVGKRLDAFLVEKIPEFSRSHIKNMIENGLINIDGKAPAKAGVLLKNGQNIFVEVLAPQNISTKAEDIDFEIVFEDDDLVVVNKPQGLVVHPCSSTKSGTLVNGLLGRITNLSGINGVLRPGIVHRLDKDTSGLMVVAKNDFAHRSLAEQIKNKTCHRNYLAVVEGHFKEDSGQIKTFIGRDPKDRKKMAVLDSGRVAITDYKTLKYFEGASLVEFSLQTGRTHQIRVHCKHLAHPIVGDKVYGKEKKGLSGQLLHAYKLSFFHPRTGKMMTFEAGLPCYFEEYLKKLKEI
jgi:23S rRNA pseudouridine1911/1915/1917 synthase